jgi:hypothetical protein
VFLCDLVCSGVFIIPDGALEELTEFVEPLKYDPYLEPEATKASESHQPSHTEPILL